MLAMRLALEVGTLDVDGLMDGLSTSRLLEWGAYFALQHPQAAEEKKQGRLTDWRDIQAFFGTRMAKA